MKADQKAQHIGDEFHAITNTLDALMARTAELRSKAIQFRFHAGIKGHESQRTLERIDAAESHLMNARKGITSAHLSAEQLAITAGSPTECPDDWVFVGAELEDHQKAVGE